MENSPRSFICRGVKRLSPNFSFNLSTLLRYKKNNFAILISFLESWTANPALNFFNIEVNYERLLLRRVWM